MRFVLDIPVELEPFRVPNYVMVAKTTKEEDRKFHLKELPAEALERLCDQFRKEVFKKSGKVRPDWDHYS